ncbi:hypothetical protein [Kineococcus radiotolerans]|uniref:hypothetical protein n=1 Tax=Kineococcus radiotolerans TaxID=131568 RepID=UPI0002E47A81|nr:hypothetical protein [Kineococcus radiotolerans]
MATTSSIVGPLGSYGASEQEDGGVEALRCWADVLAGCARTRRPTLTPARPDPGP